MGVEKGGFRAFRLHTCANFRTFAMQLRTKRAGFEKAKN